MKKYQSIYWEKQRKAEVREFVNTYIGGYMQNIDAFGVFLDDDEPTHKQHTFEMCEFMRVHGIEDWRNNALTIGTKDGGSVAIGEIVLYMDKKTTKSRNWTLEFIFRDVDDKEVNMEDFSLDGLYEFLDEIMSWNADDENVSYTPEDFIKLEK